MELREKAEEVFAWGLAKRQDKLAFAWENHSRGAAEVAEKIAGKCGMDTEKAYAMGLLHDIGRCIEGRASIDHVIDGYEILKDQGVDEEIARICLTHSFNPKEKVNEITLSEEAQDKFLKKYLEGVEFDDYDRLIQLADFMSGADGITTVERRFCSVILRHGLKDPRGDLKKLYELKSYFDKKVGIDVYELFHEKIAEAAFRGMPGRQGVAGA